MQTNRNLRTKIKCKEYENLGAYGGTKSDEFLEKFQWGRGDHFQSKNLYCRFWELQTGLFEREIDTKST